MDKFPKFKITDKVISLKRKKLYFIYSVFFTHTQDDIYFRYELIDVAITHPYLAYEDELLLATETSKLLYLK